MSNFRTVPIPSGSHAAIVTTISSFRKRAQILSPWKRSFVGNTAAPVTTGSHLLHITPVNVATACPKMTGKSGGKQPVALLVLIPALC